MSSNIKSRPPLFIDTCALSDKDFLKWLKEYRGEKSISSIVYMEYCTYLIGRGITPDKLDSLLKRSGISVSQFNREQARNASMIMDGLDERRCSVCNNINWNDCMIAASAPCAPTVLVTKNVKDFEIFVEWKGRLKTPKELMCNH